MKILIIQHEESTPAGSILKWIQEKNFEYRIYSFNSELPSPNIYLDFEFDLLIILGGSMNLTEEANYLWISEEKIFIEKQIVLNKKILGICLGAQILAHLLGGKVLKAETPEIGWFDVRMEDSNEMVKCLHWHSYQFNLPPLAILNSTSPGCPVQGFSLGKNILAYQFHPEADDHWVTSNVQNAQVPPSERFIQTRAEILAGLIHQKEMERWFFIQLDFFCNSQSK